jgi:hypothetical protein
MGVRYFLPFAFTVLPACAPGRLEPLRPVDPPPPATRLEHGEEIVAIFNGEPLPWRVVAGKMLELDLKTAVDQYIRWRVIEDRRATLGISHTPDELRRRADAYARQVRKRVGEEAFRAQIEREGTTAEAWTSHVASSRFLNEMLTLDKILRYNALLEDQLETDRMLFVEEADAAKFVDAARVKGYDAAAEELEKAGRRPTLGRIPREVFARSAPPANPVLDEWVVEALLKLKPGEFTGVEHSRSNWHYVVLLRNLRKGRSARYDEVKGEVMEGILADPPADPDYQRWMDRELARSRVEYGERKAAAGNPR